MIYTARVLDQNRTLLGILDCSNWSYSRKISEATEVSVTIPRKQSSTAVNCDELFTFINPILLTEIDDSWDTSADPTQELAYFIEIYKDKLRLITAFIAKRDFTDTTIELKCYTEETLLTKHLTPAQYGRVYEGWDIADIARDMAKGWSVQRIKAKSQWEAGTLVNTDTTTEPGKVLLSKTGGIYNASGSVTLTFTKPANWANWERIRWVGDYDGSVATKMQYSTNGGSTWSAEYVGGEPDTLGIEVSDTSANTVMVRLLLTTTDTTSEDSDGNAVGTTPVLFAVEVIARTTAYLTVSAEASTGLVCTGLELDSATPFDVLAAACDQVGQEFWVDDSTLYLGTMGSDKSNEIFLRKGTNMRISQLGDELDEVYNVIHAIGSGSGINRLKYTESDATSVATYGVRETLQEFDTEDYDELVALAQAYLAEHKDPVYSWKVKALYPIDDEPTYGCGDTITVTDGVIVTTSRIEQMDRSYDSGISVLLYLNKTRADLVQRVVPTYADLATFERPVSLSVYPTIKGLVVSVSRPVDLSRWDYTELHISTVSEFTPSNDTLSSGKKATMFEVSDLTPGTRYFVKVRHVATDGTLSEFSDERSAIPLAVTSVDVDITTGWDITENSPSAGQVTLYGKDIDGNPTTENGFINSGSGVLVVNDQSITPMDGMINFLVLSSGVVVPVYYDVNENKFFDGSLAEVTTGVIIGTVTKESGLVTASQSYTRAITIEQGKADQVSTAMRYLAQATSSESFDTIAKGLGIENVFTTLAVYNAFIIKLSAQHIKLNEDGSIYSDFYNADGTVNTSSTATKGLFLGADGRSKLFNSEVLGTLRTGDDAPTDARVGIRDRIGITSGPAFTGTGVDDMTIVSDDGLVAGDLTVKISSLDNADNMGTEAAGFSLIAPVNTAAITGMCANASGRIVAVTNSGYIRYSDDGITWTNVNLGTYYWGCLAMNSSGLFVAFSGNKMTTSSDGATWSTPITIAAITTSIFHLFVTSTGVFVGQGQGGVYSSPDTVTWTKATIPEGPAGETIYWVSLAVNSNDVIVIGGTEDTQGEDGVIAYATYSGGLTFSTPFYSSPRTLYPYFISTDGATQFFLVSNVRDLYTSTDGSSWAYQGELPSGGHIIKVHAGLYLLLGSYIYMSSDGITFSSYYTLPGRSNGFVYDNRLYIYGAGGNIARGLYQDGLVWSDDAGSSWSAEVLIPYSKQYTIPTYDIVIGFGSTVGHTVDDFWDFTQSVMKGLVIQDNDGTTYFDASNGVLTVTQINAEDTTNKVYGAVFN